MAEKESQTVGLKPVFSPLGIWAFSIGTSIGWGSFIVTCNTYLLKAGVLGTVFGLLIGLAVILVITANLQYIIKQNPGRAAFIHSEDVLSEKIWASLCSGSSPSHILQFFGQT